MKKLLIGADPEIFLADAAGAFVSAVDKIGGTKVAPMPLEYLGDGFAVQEDNVAVEFNIAPADSAETLKDHINKTVKLLSTMVHEAYDLHFVNVSAVSFPEDQLRDPKAQQFGCDPDFNAWTGAVNPRPRAADKNLRSCGGHIHVGYPFRDRREKLRMVQMMDLMLGVPSTLMDQGELRKNLYGKHGAFREKPYGVEYRTLSNFWIFDDKLIEWVWRNTERALEAVMNGTSPDKQLQGYIIDAIDNNNKEIAAMLINMYDLDVVYA